MCLGSNPLPYRAIDLDNKLAIYILDEDAAALAARVAHIIFVFLL